MLTNGDSRLGSTIDRYRLLSVLGAGSTSVVYLGQPLDDPRALVAIKVLNYPTTGPSSDHATFRARFVREARAASRLRNEFILPVLSYGDRDDLTYMVMPVIVGGTLAMRLTNERRPLPLDEIAVYLRQLASALDYAHEQGVVHRDVKPSNILLDEHRHVYLTDFGIARLFESGDNALTREGPMTLTRTGQVLGTPYYMAPEQIRGDQIGPAADTYALGVVIYQLVTGQVPFQGDTPLVVALQHLQNVPPPPSRLREELPPPIESVILRSLAKNPTDRFESAADMARAFEGGLSTLRSAESSRAATQAWPFSTSYHMQAPGPAETPPNASSGSGRWSGTPDELVGATVDIYHIDRVLNSDDTGDTFLTSQGGGTLRLHLSRPPRDLPADQQTGYLDRLRERAPALAALRQANLLPVLDWGDYRGLPYVVTADVPGPSLADVIERDGPLPLTTSANYLDQMAEALESAQDRGVLHLRLTPDCVYVLGDGQRVLVDFAERLPAQPSPQEALPATGRANTPEQILGQPEGMYTDVYALGAVLYTMLTARPVFTGATRDDIARQHLRAPVPGLRESRPDLPVGADHVVARAMAKAPAERFAHPRELAVAFRRVIGRGGEAAFVMARPPEASALATTPALPILADLPGVQAAGRAPAAALPDTRGAPSVADTPPPPPPSASEVREPQQGAGQAPPSGVVPMAVPVSTPPPASGGRRPSRRLIVEIACAVVLLGLLGGTLAWFTAFKSGPSTASGPSPTAVATFADTPGHAGASDAVQIADVTNLPTPPAGEQYVAWVVDEQQERFIQLGPLIQDTQGFTLTYQSTDATRANLIGFGNVIEVTLEKGQVSAPVGSTVVLKGIFPPHAFVHIKHLLFSFPSTPGQQGLLVGMLQQTTVLVAQAQHLRDYQQRGFPNSFKCAAQNIVNVIEGSKGQNYGPLNRPFCDQTIAAVDDGYGLLGTDGYLAMAARHAALAAQSSDATPFIRKHAQHIEICVTNVTGWLTTVDQDAVSILNGNNDPATVQDIVKFSNLALNGQNLDGDETIDPVTGEGGVDTAYEHSHLLASLPLVAVRS